MVAWAACGEEHGQAGWACSCTLLTRAAMRSPRLSPNPGATAQPTHLHHKAQAVAAQRQECKHLLRLVGGLGVQREGECQLGGCQAHSIARQ